MWQKHLKQKSMDLIVNRDVKQTDYAFTLKTHNIYFGYYNGSSQLRVDYYGTKNSKSAQKDY